MFSICFFFVKNTHRQSILTSLIEKLSENGIIFSITNIFLPRYLLNRLVTECSPLYDNEGRQLNCNLASLQLMNKLFNIYESIQRATLVHTHFCVMNCCVTHTHFNKILVKKMSNLSLNRLV